jgi:hypothetical protein
MGLAIDMACKARQKMLQLHDVNQGQAGQDADLFGILHGNYGRRCQRFFGNVFRIVFGILFGIFLGYYMDAKPASWYKRCQRWDIARKKLMGYEWDMCGM